MARNLPLEAQGSPEQPLGMSTALFLRYYWQRAPLLIRQAFPGFQAPLSGDDLAALACDDQALARLVRYRRRSDRWEVQHGPLSEADFDQLPAADWTLLVQDVDKWDPEVAALLAHFDFIPRWRVDDIMVSFAAPGGSVGAHVDHYDVFLLQGQGQRHWAIDATAEPDLSYRDDVPLKLLRHFQPSHDWLLQPGDMLYLPPGIPHHGVAEGACLTLSIGMRAPATGELLLPLIDEFAEELGEAQRFTDPGREPCAQPDTLEDDDVERFRNQIEGALKQLQSRSKADLADFCARFLSQYRQAAQPQPPRRAASLNAIAKALKDGKRMHLANGLRGLRRRTDPPALFVAGQRWALPDSLSDSLTGDGLDYARWSRLDADLQQRLRQMLGEGLLALVRR